MIRTIRHATWARRAQIGKLRGCSSLLVYTQREIDRTAEAELKVKGNFPESDIDLERWWSGMPKVVKSYAAGLARCGFSKEEQEKLVRDMAEFGKAMRARKRRKTASTKAARERDQVFADLRWSTQVFRRIGRVALRSSPDRTRFDRVAYVPPKAAKKSAGKGTDSGDTTENQSVGTEGTTQTPASTANVAAPPSPAAHPPQAQA